VAMAASRRKMVVVFALCFLTERKRGFCLSLDKIRQVGEKHAEEIQKGC